LFGFFCLELDGVCLSPEFCSKRWDVRAFSPDSVPSGGKELDLIFHCGPSYGDRAERFPVFALHRCGNDRSFRGLIQVGSASYLVTSLGWRRLEPPQ